MADILQITLPDGTTYNIKDNNALPLIGGQVTGPVTFGDSVSIDDLTAGNIIVTGAFNAVQGIPYSMITGTPTIPSAATATPVMDGTAAVGTSAKYAREDHVHPSDMTKVDKEALDDAGIHGKTYTTMFGGAFTVTTAVDADHGSNPFARSSISGRLSKQYKYRVTVNGDSYILPSQLFDYTVITESTGTFNLKVIEYVGNSSLFRLSDSGLLNEKFQSIPFLIVSDDEGLGYLDLYTEEAGSYTVLIEKIEPTYETLPNVLIYDQEYVPFQTNISDSTYEVFSAGVNRFGSSARTAFAFGNGNNLNAFGAFAAGSSNAVSGSDAVAFGKINTSSGNASIATGWENTASGVASRAHGFSSSATGSCADACGYLAVATGNSSYACGFLAIATGNMSHAEGDGVVASARGSHVEGGGTISDASHRYVHVGGVNNAVSTETGKTVSITRRDKDGNVIQTNNQPLGKYAEIIGNGDSDAARSNARTLDWDGNESLAGNLTLGMGTANQTSITAQQLNGLLSLPSSGLITDAVGTSRKVYLTTTEAVPSGAVTGDIVFVKVT